MIGVAHTGPLPSAAQEVDTTAADAWLRLLDDGKTGGNRGVIETVVPSLDTDGRWRVGGYFIRPQ
jgi:hypothetical protein